MKNQILDDIFNDKLRDQLEEGEVVIWEGKPRFNNYNRLIAIGFIFLVFGINLIEAISKNKHWMIAIHSLILILLIIQLFFIQKKTRYLITNFRIIFQLPKGRRTQFHSLPLHHLEKVVVNKGKNKNGTINLILKKSFKTEIKTINIKMNSRRKNPTLEMIENVEEVATYIRKGIQENLQISDYEK